MDAVDAGQDFLVLTFSPLPNAVRYELQYRRKDTGDEDVEWTALGSGFDSPRQLKKKNLQPGSRYEFRVRCRDKFDWNDWTESFECRTLPVDAKQMAPPQLVKADIGSLVISWEVVAEAERYELQLRRTDTAALLEDDPQAHWVTISSKLTTTVRFPL